MNTQLYCETDIHFRPPKNSFFTGACFLSENQIKLILNQIFSVLIVLIEDIWNTQRYIIGEEISTKSRASWEDFLRSVSSKDFS